jgi:hypothetical protein
MRLVRTPKAVLAFSAPPLKWTDSPLCSVFLPGRTFHFVQRARSGAIIWFERVWSAPCVFDTLSA